MTPEPMRLWTLPVSSKIEAYLTKAHQPKDNRHAIFKFKGHSMPNKQFFFKNYTKCFAF